MVIPLARWVAPFGDPGITDRSHLPRAFRSVPRPSSPLSAKASTRCPSFALPQPHPTARTISGSRSQEPGARSAPAHSLPPPSVRQTLLSEDTSRGTRHSLSAAASPATVTQLASSPCRINNTPRLPIRERRGAKLLHAASCLLHRAPAPLRVCGANPCRRARPVRFTVSAVANTVVEVIGLEPTTSCLQSRRSPS